MKWFSVFAKRTSNHDAILTWGMEQKKMRNVSDNKGNLLYDYEREKREKNDR